MSSFTLLLKQFFKNKLLSIFSVSFFAIMIGLLLKGVITCYQMNSEPLDYLLQTLSISIYTFIYFMFISNEYLFKIKQYDVDEVLKSTKKGFQSYYFTGVSVLILIAFVYTAVILVINTVIYFMLKIHHPEYLFHIIWNILLNLFCISLLGILLGAVLSLFKKRIVSYVCMIAIVFLSSPMFELIATSVYTGMNKDIYALYDFFNIFPPLLQWAPLQSFGYSLLPYRMELFFFWFFACLLILSLFIFKQKGKKALYLSAICGAAGLICLVGYFQPASKVTMSEAPSTGANADVIYYDNYNANPSPAQFSVNQYNLDMNINKQLNVKATLLLEPNKLTAYDFTLYHGYKVKKVTDANGQELAFSQAGDYVTVDSKGRTLDRITISYAGSSPKFFSNVQGVSLPGWFAYYPRPGRIALYNSSQQSFTRILCQSDTEFQVTIDSPGKIYCNLNGSDHSFSGKSNGITLVGGFYDTATVNGIEVIYPYLANSEFTAESINNFVQEYLSQGIITKEQKKVFVLPNTNITSAYERYCGFDDHITIRQFAGLPVVYDMQKIPEHKLSLYMAFDVYKKDKASFDGMVDFKRQEYEELGEDPVGDIYILLDDKLKEFGAAYTEEKVEAYLADRSASKDGFVFLNELQR